MEPTFLPANLNGGLVGKRVASEGGAGENWTNWGLSFRHGHRLLDARPQERLFQFSNICVAGKIIELNLGASAIHGAARSILDRYPVLTLPGFDLAS